MFLISSSHVLKLWGIYSDINTDRQLVSMWSLIINNFKKKKKKKYIQMICIDNFVMEKKWKMWKEWNNIIQIHISETDNLEIVVITYLLLL